MSNRLSRIHPRRSVQLLRYAAFLMLLLSHLPRSSGQSPDVIRFERDVFPIFQRACVECHGAKKQEAELRLDQPFSESGRELIEPGNAERSELFRRITLPESHEERMPATGRMLAHSDVAMIRRWITEGAVWPADFQPPRHWAYVPPVRPASAGQSATSEPWCRTPVDELVLQHLKKRGLAPSPEADPVTLLRRVTLDLTGLPPTPAEVESFVRDPSYERYEKIVDDLLSRPQFGERWARPWLDLARYADSHGFQRDDLRDIWAYRDWVIQALNDDMPFDRFTIEQLAGDLLPDAAESQIIATGFHRCAMTNVEAGSIPEETRAEQLIDRVNTTATVWLGSTLECAQCHDHKYDPFTMKDYYGLLAFFNNTAIEADRSNPRQPSSIVFLGPSMPVKSAARDAERARLKERLHALEAAIADRRLALDADLAEWARKQVTATTEPNEEVLRPVSFRSLGTTDRFEVLEDGSVLLAGDDPPARDTYELTSPCELDRIEAFRVEALTHDTLPGRGPGRGDPSRPNFVLSEFSVSIVSDSEQGESQQVPFRFEDATADFSQAKWDVRGAVDGKADTGWAIAPQFGKPHSATFVLAEPWVRQDGAQNAPVPLRIRLEQNFGNARTLGHFRITAIRQIKAASDQSLPPKLNRLARRDPAKWNAQQRKELLDHRMKTDAETTKLRDESSLLNAALKSLEPETTLIMKEETVRPSFVFERGDYRKPGSAVTPQVPSGLHAPTEGPPNRLTLARWLVARENPLTARVTVNRWWAELFGRGLVATPEDFGIKGEPPSHQELLDWLAVEFMDHDWSMKHILRTIVLSSVYRQSSHTTTKQLEHDDLNIHLARGPRFRMDAEMLRDNALAISGLLDLRQGGPPIRPPQPEGLWAKIGGVQYDYEVSPPGERHRRSIYVVIKRSAPNPTLNTFDASNRLTCSAKRVRTNTPLQALSLLNDPVFADCAAAMAGRILKERPSVTDQDRVNYAVQLAVGRTPRDSEQKTLLRMLNDQRDSFRTRPNDAAKIAKDATWEDASVAADFAAWVSVCRVLLNLHETITKP